MSRLTGSIWRFPSKGASILYPLVGGAGLKVIQQAEVKDVRRVIEVLSQGN